jgi:hypothetical protein
MTCGAQHPQFKKTQCERLVKCQEEEFHAGRGPRGYWVSWECRDRTIEMSGNPRKSLLLRAMERQDDRCFWCRCSILCLSEPHTLTILTQNPWNSSALIDGKRIVLGHASADHVIPQWLGGQTTERNIVAACKKCNEDRGQMHNRSWYVIDATGFDAWLKRQREPKKRRGSFNRPRTLFGTSLRPLLMKVLAPESAVVPTLAEEYAREVKRGRG